MIEKLWLPAYISIMPSPPRRRETFKAKRARKAAIWKAEHGGTPYANWPAAEMREQVVAAMGKQQFPLPTWRKGGKDRQRRLTVDDLAVGLWAVAATNGKGTSYGQVGRCFHVCAGVGCHNAKAATMLACLQRLGLIMKVKGHSPGSHGTVYETVPSDPAKADLQRQQAAAAEAERLRNNHHRRAQRQTPLVMDTSDPWG